MPMIINGIGVSRGTAQGRVHMLKRSGGNIAKRELAPEQVEPELARLSEAIEQARTQLTEVRGLVPETMSQEVQSFLDARSCAENFCLSCSERRMARRPSAGFGAIAPW